MQPQLHALRLALQLFYLYQFVDGYEKHEPVVQACTMIQLANGFLDRWHLSLNSQLKLQITLLLKN